MPKPPSFQFYPSDFLSDENVVLMNNAEVGCYIKLLCFCWKQGSIPDNIDRLARLCNEKYDVMAQLWLAIKPCFKNGDIEGRLIHQRLEKERQKQIEFRQERAESGRKGADIRWKKKKNSSAMAKPMAKPMANHSSSSSTSIKENIIKEKLVLGEFKNVKLSDEEYQKLITKFGETGTKQRIENLSEYIASKGKKYSSHYATILSWERKNTKEDKKPCKTPEWF